MVDRIVLSGKIAAIRDAVERIRDGVIDLGRLYAIASADVGDLLLFCQQLASRAEAP